jgi:putative transposase
MMVWNIIGMSIFGDVPMRIIVNILDILLSGNRPFVIPSAAVQDRQRHGTQAIKLILLDTTSMAGNSSNVKKRISI